MAQPHTSDLGPVGPIPQPLIDASLREPGRSRMVLSNLNFLSQFEANAYLPNVWGYRIYRATTGPDSEARFTAGVARLEAWMRWSIRQCRYRDEDAALWAQSSAPPLGQPDATDEMARRLWNEAVADYPGRETLRRGLDVEDGDEDFSAIGRAHLAWLDNDERRAEGVIDFDVRESQLVRNNRYDYAIILDDKALQSFDALPAEVPELVEDGNDAVYDVFIKSWVWALDRVAMRRLETGSKPMFPPWLRMPVFQLHDSWYARACGRLPQEWQFLAAEDRHKPERVFWWNPHAGTLNQFSRQFRGAAPVPRGSRYE